MPCKYCQSQKLKDSYELVDEAIGVIYKSGMKYQVCPFDTAIEGPYEKIMKVVEEVQQTNNVTIKEKMKKYM